MTYTQWKPRRRRRRNPLGPIIGIFIIVAILLAAGAIATNAFGVGERWEHLVQFTTPHHEGNRPLKQRVEAPQGYVNELEVFAHFEIRRKY